jgi:hypothetical protein
MIEQDNRWTRSGATLDADGRLVIPGKAEVDDVIHEDADVDDDAATPSEWQPYAEQVVGSLVLSLRAWRAVSEVLAGVDMADAARRFGLSDLELAEASRLYGQEARPQTRWDGKALLGTTFRPLDFAVSGLLPTGLAIVASAPKTGKTRLATQLAVAVATGEDALGFATGRRPVLMLALEDGVRRIRELLAHHPDGSRLESGALDVSTLARALDDGGLNDLDRWLTRQSGPALVVIDVLERIRPKARGNVNAYRADYGDLSALQSLAVRRDAAILLVHHTNQTADAADPFTRISGSSGLIGVVDTLWLLDRRRQDNLGLLTVVGRDIEDRELVLAFDRGWWTPSKVDSVLLGYGREVRALWEWLSGHEGATTAELAAQYGHSENTSLKVLYRLEDAGLVDRLDGSDRPKRGVPVRWCVVVVRPDARPGDES